MESIGSYSPSATREPEEFEPGCQRAGWQHEASSRVEREFRRFVAVSLVLKPLFTVDADRARSLQGVVSAASCPPVAPFQPPLDAFGHHRAACARCGVLGRRGFALENATGRVCREAGARVATNQFVRDLDLGVPNANDNRRLEVVADGLPLFGGVQLAVDTTLVSAVRGDGGAADRDGVALRRARKRKEATYPELIRAGARARLVAWEWKWAAVGPKRLGRSSRCWRKHA